MCRLAAHLGKEVSLDEFLREPEHSLIKQSWAPKEMQEGTINADGYGITWLTKTNIPCTYKSLMPIWSDTNLEGLGRSLNSRLWMANVRSATPGQGLSGANTQPFIKDKLIFMHNGCIKPFSNETKTALMDIISPVIRTEIKGDTDSLYLFALLQQHLQNHSSIPDAIKSMMDELKSIIDTNTSALLNLIISDSECFYICRHAIQANCPSLYYCQQNESIRVASEPLTPEDEWMTVTEHSVMTITLSEVIENHVL